MTTFRCNSCGKITGTRCPFCSSGFVEAIGDVDLRFLYIDAYISVQMYLGKSVLIIKKPSGQVIIDLQEEDKLPGF